MKAQEKKQYRKIGKQMKEAREMVFTLGEMAKAMGISRQYLMDMEQAHRPYLPKWRQHALNVLFTTAQDRGATLIKK